MCFTCDAFCNSLFLLKAETNDYDIKFSPSPKLGTQAISSGSLRVIMCRMVPPSSASPSVCSSAHMHPRTYAAAFPGLNRMVNDLGSCHGKPNASGGGVRSIKTKMALYQRNGGMPSIPFIISHKILIIIIPKVYQAPFIPKTGIEPAHLRFRIK